MHSACRLALAICLLQVSAIAQPISADADSIEWITMDSTVIVRGTIAALQTRQDSSGGEWHAVTLAVDETLLGQHEPQRQFVVRSNADDLRLRTWHEARTPLAAFLKPSPCLVARDGPRFMRFALAPRTGWCEGSLIDLSGTAGPQVFTLELSVLSDPAAITRAIEDSIKSAPVQASRCDHRLQLPRQASQNTAWRRYTETGGAIFLHVPIDARLESQAVRWIESPNGELRVLGAGALLYFRSDANAARLRRLLEDPYAVRHQRVGREMRLERVYEVRRAAAMVLEAWTGELPQTVTVEPAPAATP